MTTDSASISKKRRRFRGCRCGRSVRAKVVRPRESKGDLFGDDLHEIGYGTKTPFLGQSRSRYDCLGVWSGGACPALGLEGFSAGFCSWCAQTSGDVVVSQGSPGLRGAADDRPLPRFGLCVFCLRGLLDCRGIEKPCSTPVALGHKNGNSCYRESHIKMFSLLVHPFHPV